MKPIFYLCVFVFSFTLFGCSSSDDSLPIPETDIPEEIAPLIIKNVSTIVTFLPDCPPRNADFNTDGQITQIHSCGQPFRTFSRNSEGQITDINDVGSFGYENGLWTSTSSGNDTGSSHATIVYNDNIMTLSFTDNGNHFPFQEEYIFEDDSYEKILMIRTINTTNNQIRRRISFTYSDNSVSTIHVEILDQDTNELVPFINHSFTYDNKINPYKIGMPTNAAFVARTPFLFWDQEEGVAWLSEHNFTERIFTYHPNNMTKIYTYDYEYDEAGYPIKMEEFVNEELQYIQSYEYY